VCRSSSSETPPKYNRELCVSCRLSVGTSNYRIVAVGEATVLFLVAEASNFVIKSFGVA
jgi:hypothetical protein